MGVDFSGITLPFSAADLLSSAMGLVGVLGAFVLLGLAVTFAPRIIGLINNATIMRTVSSLKGTLEVQDRDGNPVRSWRSRNARYD